MTMQNESAEERVALKACPFCGRQPKPNGGVHRAAFGFRCSYPDHLVQSYGATEEDAAEAWNRRAALTAWNGRNGGVEKHPWYGPCDALGPNGGCAECLKATALRAPTVEAVADAMRNEPFVDDIPFVGTTQQDQRCEHYARAALRALPVAGVGEKRL